MVGLLLSVVFLARFIFCFYSIIHGSGGFVQLNLNLSETGFSGLSDFQDWSLVYQGCFQRIYVYPLLAANP